MPRLLGLGLGLILCTQISYGEINRYGTDTKHDRYSNGIKSKLKVVEENPTHYRSSDLLIDGLEDQNGLIWSDMIFESSYEQAEKACSDLDARLPEYFEFIRLVQFLGHQEGWLPSTKYSPFKRGTKTELIKGLANYSFWTSTSFDGNFHMPQDDYSLFVWSFIGRDNSFDFAPINRLHRSGVICVWDNH